MGREDLTEWALHFVHDYNPQADPDMSTIDFGHFGGIPYHQDKKINDRFDTWRISDEHYPIDPDPDALQVLLKIITDGHIRASWAFRNGRPTIYGPRAAVCLTEMPLYALVEYAKQRSTDLVGTYAVGVLKRELFAAGGDQQYMACPASTKSAHRRVIPIEGGLAIWPSHVDSAKLNNTGTLRCLWNHKNRSTGLTNESGAGRIMKTSTLVPVCRSGSQGNRQPSPRFSLSYRTRQGSNGSSADFKSCTTQGQTTSTSHLTEGL